MKMLVGVMAGTIALVFLLPFQACQKQKTVKAPLTQADKLIGVWKLTEIQSPAPSLNSTNPQPNITIFTKKHFSIVGVSGEKPRPEIQKDPTKEQLMELFRTFGSLAGTYEVEDSNLTMHFIVSWVPSIMNKRNTQARKFRFEGDNLVLTQAPPESPEMLTTWKYARLE